MSFSFVDHRQKILQEIIRLFENCTRLTKGGQILSLNLIELFGVTHKQPDRRIHRIFLDALWIDRSPYFSLLEGFQVTVNAIRRSRVALGFDLSPKSQTIAFPFLPALKDVGSKGIKRTLSLAAFLGFGKGSSRKPALHRATTEAKLLCNGLWLHSLLPQLHDLLIAGVATNSSGQSDFLHICRLWSAPFFNGDHRSLLLI